jgi:hypothetical protein
VDRALHSIGSEIASSGRKTKRFSLTQYQSDPPRKDIKVGLFAGSTRTIRHMSTHLHIFASGFCDPAPAVLGR